LDAGNVGYLDVLLRYGPLYLTVDEFAARKEKVLAQYYRTLGGCVWKMKNRQYWRFHRSRLKEIGVELEWSRVAKAAIQEAIVEARNPMTAMRKVVAVLKGRPLDSGLQGT